MSVQPHVVLACGIALSVVGCARPRHAELRSEHPLAVSEPSAEADRLWEMIQDTLRRHRFQMDRVDRAAGVITTFPETSQQFFEFWRKDVACSRDAWEATLNPIRRWVEVTLAGAGPGAPGWNEISVVVHKERLSSPDRQFNNSGAAYQYFGESLPATSGQYRVTAKDDRWLDLGRDPAMEHRILGIILADAGDAKTSPTPPES